MADTESYIKPRILGSQVPPNHANPYNFHTHFMYKAVIVAVFLVVLPLLTSQSPEFINQTLHTRSWELVQLLLVGIAVSYGLFSRRNDETEKEHTSKFDNAHSYVSRFLQVSSVFDDEADSPSGSDENKLQTWNSQHYRGEPVVVVAQESSVLEEQRGTSSRVGEKPLLLPIRSLKSRVSDSDATEVSNESSGRAGSLIMSSSSSGSKRFSNKSRNGEFGGSIPLDLEEKVEENVVLRSPIPWRSRSGRMEMKEEIDGVPLYSLPPSMEESEFNRLESRSFRSQTSRSSRPNSTSPSSNKPSPSPSLSSPKNPSPSPSRSFSMESQAKNAEEVARKKIYYKSSPPPAPPPPPPPPPLYVRKPPLVKPNSSLSNSEFGENGMSGRAERRSKEVEATSFEKTGRYDKLIHESVPLMSKPTFSNYQKKEAKQESNEYEIVETDEDSESDDDVFEGGSDIEEVASNSVGDGGPDVNKKAEEFIAKFREQIRLQRIESIKSSTRQIARNSSRIKSTGMQRFLRGCPSTLV